MKLIQISQVAGFNSLADVLKRLDFTSAIRDVRRFQSVKQSEFNLIISIFVIFVANINPLGALISFFCNWAKDFF